MKSYKKAKDMSVNELLDAIKLKTKESNKQKEEEEEDYCVESFKEVGFKETNHNLIFGKKCEIQSLTSGDGVFVDKKYVQAITLYEKSIWIYLKGTKQKLFDGGEVVYGELKNK